MADIIIKGQAHEATVRMNYEMDGWVFDCSKGTWCELEKGERETLSDVIHEAINHVDRHDSALDNGIPDRA